MATINLDDHVRDIQDFPKPGIVFKDITPLLANPLAFNATIDRFEDRYRKKDIDAVIGIESRGFIFGAPLAARLNAAFIPVRKPGKLPYDKIRHSYDLEYGSDTLEMHADAVNEKHRVLVIDDLLATGGTVQACLKLLEQLGPEVVECAFCIHLKFLEGEKKLSPNSVYSLLEY